MNGYSNLFPRAHIVFSGLKDQEAASVGSEASEDSDDETFVGKEVPQTSAPAKLPSKQSRGERESTRVHAKPTEMVKGPFKSVADLVEEQQREFEKENALQLMNAIKVIE